MADIHTLILRSDSTQIKQSAKDLDGLSNSANKTEKSTDQLGKTSKSTSDAINMLSRAAVGLAAGLTISKIINYADSWSLVNSRLKLATDSTMEYSKAQKELFAISQQSRQDFGATADLYSRMARATKSLGTSQEDLFKITSTVNKALVVSGASAQEASSVITQLGQGLASGVLRGEEFNSIMENGSRVAQALSDSLNISTGELRAMAQEGMLTSEVVMKALIDQTGKVSEEFDQMATTVDQASTVFTNGLGSIINKMNEASGATNFLSKVISAMGRGLANFDIDNMLDFNTMSYRIHQGLITPLDQTAEKAKQAEIRLKEWGAAVKEFERFDINFDDVADLDTSSLTKAGYEIFLEYEKKREAAAEKAARKAESLAKQLSDEKIRFEKEWAEKSIELSRETASAQSGEMVAPYLALMAAYEDDLEKYKSFKDSKSLIDTNYSAKLDKLNKETIEKSTTDEKALISLSLKSKLINLDFKRQAAELMDDENERAIALADINLERIRVETEAQYQKGELTKEQYDMQIKLAERTTEKVKQGYLEIGQMMRAVSSSMTTEFGSFFDYADSRFLDFANLARSILHEIYMEMVKMAIVKPLVGAVMGGFTANAKGGTYDSPSLSGYSNQIVSQPTAFMFASGGTPGTNLGIMGEAGSEAIMPLTRTPDGDLGVKSIGGNAPTVIINIENNTDTQIQEETKTSFDGERMIVTTVLSAIARNKFGARDVIRGTR